MKKGKILLTLFLTATMLFSMNGNIFGQDNESTPNDTAKQDVQARAAADDDLKVVGSGSDDLWSKDTVSIKVDNEATVTYKVNGIFEGSDGTQKSITIKVPQNASLNKYSGNTDLGVEASKILGTDQDTLKSIDAIISDVKDGCNEVTYYFNSDTTSVLLSFEVTFTNDSKLSAERNLSVDLTSNGAMVTKNANIIISPKEVKEENKSDTKKENTSEESNGKKATTSNRAKADEPILNVKWKEGIDPDNISVILWASKGYYESPFTSATCKFGNRTLYTNAPESKYSLNYGLYDQDGNYFNYSNIKYGESKDCYLTFSYNYDENGQYIGKNIVGKYKMTITNTGPYFYRKSTGTNLNNNYNDRFVSIEKNGIIDLDFIKSYFGCKDEDGEVDFYLEPNVVYDTSVSGNQVTVYLRTINKETLKVESTYVYVRVINSEPFIDPEYYYNPIINHSYNVKSYNCSIATRFKTLPDDLRGAFYNVDETPIDKENVTLISDGGLKKNLNYTSSQTYNLKYEIVDPNTNEIYTKTLTVNLSPNMYITFRGTDYSSNYNTNDAYTGRLYYADGYSDLKNNSFDGNADFNQGDEKSFILNPDTFLNENKGGFDAIINTTNIYEKLVTPAYSSDYTGYTEVSLNEMLQSIDFDTTNFDINTPGYYRVPTTLTFSDKYGGYKLEGILGAYVYGYTYKQKVQSIGRNNQSFNLETDFIESYRGSYSGGGTQVETIIDDDGGLDVNTPGIYTITYHGEGDNQTYKADITVGDVLIYANDLTISEGSSIDILKNVSACYTSSALGNNKDLEVTIKKAIKDGVEVTFDKNIPGVYFMTYACVDPRDGVEYTKNAKVTVTEDKLKFDDLGDVTISKGNDFDLTSGVSASTDSGLTANIVVEDDGGFNKDVLGSYVVKYKAIHPNSGNFITGTRTVKVVDVSTNTVVSIDMSSTNAVVKTPADFKLGAVDQEAFQIEVFYEADRSESGRRLVVNIPKGFEIQGNLPVLNNASNNGVATKSGDYKTGTTFYYDFPDTSKVQVNFSLLVKQKLDVLWPGLESGTNLYNYTVSSWTGAPDDLVLSTQDKMTLTATGDGSDITINNEKKDDANNPGNYEDVYHPGQLFGSNTSNYHGESDYYNEQEKAYTITLNKEAGKIGSDDYNIRFKVPDGLRIRKSKVWLSNDSGLNTILSNNITTNVGVATINVGNEYKYSFTQNLSNYNGTSHTFFETLRDADKINIQIYFDVDSESRSLIKVNNTDDLSGANDEGYMEGSKVVLSGTDRNSHTYEELETSTNPIKLLLVNQNSNMRLVVKDSMDSSNDYIVGTNKTNYDKIYLSDKAPDSYNYSLYRNAVITQTYEYEYSPIKVDYDYNYMDCYYTVYDKNGVVSGKEKEKIFSGQEFELQDGEYVGKIVFEYKNKGALIIDDVRYYSYNPYFGVNETIYYKSKDHDINGNKLIGDKTVKIKTEASAKFHEEEVKTERAVTIRARIDNLRIQAVNNENTIENSIAPGHYNNYYANNLKLIIYANTMTMDYKNPTIIITGPAVSMLNLDSSNIVGYSTDENADNKGNGDWERDPYNVAINKLTDFKNTDKPLTGVMIDISSIIEAMSNKDDENANTTLTISTKELWSTTNGFVESGMKDQLDDHGYASLDYKIGYISDDTTTGDDGKIVGSDCVEVEDGKTAKYPLGKMVTSLSDKDHDYYVNPYAGEWRNSYNTYQLDEMELLRVNLNATNKEGAVQGNATGAHVDNSLNFGPAEGDENKEEAALLSIVGGVSLYARSYDPNADGTMITYTTSEGLTKTCKINSNEYYYMKNSNGVNQGYYYYVPFELAKGEYVTSIKVHYDDASNRTGYTSVGLVANKAIPETSLTGYKFSEGEQLSYKASFEYDDYQTAFTEADDKTTLTITTESAKIHIGANKIIESYTPTVSYDNASVIQADSTTITADNKWQFDPNTYRIGVNTLTPTIYYQLADDVYYVANSISGDAEASYDDTNHILKVTYLNPHKSGEGTGIKFTLGTTYTTTPGPRKFITAAYMDIEYEKANSVKENDYSVIFDSTSSQYIEPTFIKNTDKSAFKTDLNPIIEVTRRAVLGFVTYPTSTDPNNNKQIGSPKDPTYGTSEDRFGSIVEMMGDVGSPSEDWNVYLSVPKKGQSVDYSLQGNRLTSDKSDYDQELEGPISAFASNPFPENTKVYYTTATNPSMVGLNTSGDVTETSDYYTDDCIQEHYDLLGYESAAEFYHKVTCVKIYMPKLDNQQVIKFNVDYGKVDKDSIGEQYAYGGILFQYSKNNVLQCNEDGEPNPLMKYVLQDMYITGRAWNDLERDDVYTVDDELYPGLNLEVVGLDQDGKEYPLVVLDNATITNEGVSDASGNYKLAVPKTGDYRVKIKKTDGIGSVKEFSENGSPATQSYFGETSQSYDLDMVYNLENHTYRNVNAGIFNVIIDAVDFEYGIDEGAISEDVAKWLSCVVASENGVEVDLSKIKISPDELKKINDAIKAGTLNKYPLTFTYTYNDGGTPDDPSDDLSASKTINVYLRSNGKIDDEEAEHITATDFDFGLDSGGGLAKSVAKELSRVQATDKDGNPIDVSKIIVDDETRNKINDDIEKGIAKVGDKYPLTFSTPNGTKVTVQVTIRDNSTFDEDAKEQISADNFKYGLNEGNLSAELAKTYSKVNAVDEDGYAIDPDDLIVDQTSLDAFNTALATAKGGDVLPLTFKTPNGTETTIDVTITDSGTHDKDKGHITANDFSYAIKDESDKTNKDISISDAIKLGKAELRDKNGDVVDSSKIKVDTEQLKAINDAKNAGIIGKFPLTYTTDDGLEVKINVTLTDSGVIENDESTIYANDFIYPINKPDGTKHDALTNDVAKTLGEVFGEDENNKNYVLDDFKVDEKQMKAINDALASGKTGNYPLTYTNPDGKKAIINVTVKDNGEVKVPANSDETSIGANNFEYGLKDNDGKQTPDLTDDTAKLLSTVIATGGAGNKVDVSNIKVDETQLKAINDAKNSGEKGTYPITFTYTENNITKTAIVNITLKDVTSSVTQKPSVKDVGSIVANDFEYAAKKGDGSENEDISESLAKELSEVIGRDKDGNLIDPSKLIVDKNELAKINDAKKKGLPVKLPLTFTTSEGKKVVINVTIKTVSNEDDEDKMKLSANNFSYGIYDDKGNTNPDISKEDAINLGKAEAIKRDGSKVDPYDIEVDEDQLKVINDAKNAGQKGTYDLTYTYTDNGKTKKVTVKVELKGTGSGPVNKDDKSIINGDDFSYKISINNKENVDLTADVAKVLSGIDARDEEGNYVDLSKISVNESELKAINDAKKANKPGKYPLTFTTPDGKFITIMVTLTDPLVAKPATPKPTKPNMKKISKIDTNDNTNLAVLWVLIMLSGLVIMKKRKSLSK